jgi:hypothetical protein
MVEWIGQVRLKMLRARNFIIGLNAEIVYSQPFRKHRWMARILSAKFGTIDKQAGILVHPIKSSPGAGSAMGSSLRESPQLIIDLLSRPYDGLFLVNPFIQILEEIAKEIIGKGIYTLNINKNLSAALLSVLVVERGGYSQKWLIDHITSIPETPILCTCPDLLFEPSLQVDPLLLFRHAARVKQIIVLWPGDYSEGVLSYAVPEHHHFRTWKITESNNQQPKILIERIPTN